MAEAPPAAVEDALQGLKAKHKHHLELQKRGNGYYVFETTSYWNREKQQNSKLSLYVGRIEDDGRFSPPVRKKATTKGIDTLDQYIARMESASKDDLKKLEDEDEIKVIEALSTDARATVKEISEKVGMEANKVAYLIKKLEKKYDIKYTIDTHAAYDFGFYRFIITVKFKYKRPDGNAIKEALEKDPHVLLVMLTKGTFDLFMIVLFEGPVTLEPWLYKLRKGEMFAPLTARWNVSYFLIGEGVIPLREEFFDFIVKDRVWHRTKETPRKKPNQVFNREYAVLRALSKDGSVNFNEIDKEYNLKNGSAQYTYHELMNKNVIRRVTISMQNLPIKYYAILFLKQINIRKFEKSRGELFAYSVQEYRGLTSKFLMTGDIGSPYGVIRILPVYADGELEKIESELSKVADGIKITTAIVTNTLVGLICANKINSKQTKMYKILEEEYTHLL